MKVVLFLLLLAAITGSCIYDDYSDCTAAPFVMFSYKGDGTREIFDNKIGEVNYYLFDANKKNIRSRQIQKDELLRYHGVALDGLAPGDYYVVCVGNVYNNTEVQMKEGESLDDMHIGNPNVFDNKEAGTNDSLYIGYKKISVSNGMMSDTVHFESAHIKIYIEAAGLAGPEDPAPVKASKIKLSDLRLRIDNLIASVNFNNVAEGKFCSYTPKLSYNYTTKMYFTQFNVLRFQQKSEVTVNIENVNGENVFSMKLEDFLKKYAVYDLSKNEVLLGIHIDFLGEGIAVKAPDWVIEGEIKPEL